MKKLLFLSFALALAVTAFAQQPQQIEPSHIHKYPANDGQNMRPASAPDAGIFARTNNLLDHGGPVMTAPTVVYIFWGWSAGDNYTTALQNFRNSGLYGHSRMLGQYRSAGASAPTNFGGNGRDKFDAAQPPQAVSDAAVQAEVHKFFPGTEDTSAIYEVVIPITSYSVDGSSTSCGGPHLAYCAYHGNFNDGGRDVKYSIQPYPSCSGCRTSGFNDMQNEMHFVVHESREAISDPDLNAWYDRSGNEADDKCAWSPTPFIDQSTGFAYQYEWSNSARGCVQ